MSAATVSQAQDVVALKDTLTTLKKEREALRRQMSTSSSVSSDPASEGLIKGFLKNLYTRPMPIVHEGAKSQLEVKASLEALEESIERVRIMRKLAVQAEADSLTAKLTPARKAALLKVIEAVNSAVLANDALRKIESEIMPPYSMTWDVLGRLGWSYGETLSAWKERAELFAK